MRSLILLAGLDAAGCGLLTAVTRPPIVLNDVRAPKTGKMCQPVDVQLWATVADGCGSFPDAGAVVNEADRTVTFWGKTDRGLGLGGCPQMVMCRSRTVSFTPASTGTYTLKATLAPIRSGDCQGPWTHVEPPISDEQYYAGGNRHYDVTLKVEVTD